MRRAESFNINLSIVKPIQRGSMRLKTYSKYISAMHIFILLTILIAAALFFALIEYNKMGKCIKENRVLSAQELRIKALRDLMQYELHHNAWFQDRYKLILLQRNVTELEIDSLIKSSAILNLINESKIEVNNQSDIDGLDPVIIARPFTLINYTPTSKTILISYSGSQMKIVQSDSISVVEVEKAESDLLRGFRFEFNFLERLLGYGKNYYSFKAHHITLDCCDGNPHAESQSEIVKRNLISTRSRGLQRYLIVSNCGDLMFINEREPQMYSWTYAF